MEQIAIIGIGCRFGNVTNPQAFFDALKSGVDMTIDVPSDRWNLDSFYDPDRRIPGKISMFRGGFLPQIDGFDAKFFGISPREAASMDPQQRLMLEVSWEALEDAGLVPERLAGGDVGVFVGGFTLDYKNIQIGYLNRDLIDAHTATGIMMTMLSNRVSHAFDFRGPSMSIDTACSSSLVAVHVACASLRNGDCSIALAGGVNVIVAPEYSVAESKGGFLSPDGRSKPFSAAANGYGRAEGAGVVVLKPLSGAIADGDPIYAVIRGSAVNQDGRTNGITVPRGEAQERLIHEACSRAGVRPGQVQYVEAHGTGTPVGDPIEAGALGAALGVGRDKNNPCIVGAVKGNIGHMEAGAGVAGLIKTVMCIQNRQIPPNLQFGAPNSAIPFDQLSLRFPATLEEWPECDSAVLAGVNSFGFGGTNAHVIVEEAPRQQLSEAGSAGESACATMFPISARSPQALQAAAERMRDYARNSAPQVRFADMYYSAAFRRSHHDHRLGIVAGSSEELADLLDAHLSGELRSAVASGIVPSTGRPRLAFICTGMGPQWWAMGRQLFADEPLFRQAILDCDEYFRKEAGWSLVAEMMADEGRSRMADTAVAQPANFAIQVALAALWKSWGIEPDAIAGHSVGEVSAAYLSGALSLEQAIRVSFHRSRLQQTTAGNGAMMAAGLTEQEANEWLEPYGQRISIAAVNSPSSATLSGDPAAIEDLAGRLEAKGIFHRLLRVNIAYHSAQMDPLEEELLQSLSSLEPRTASVRLYSTVTGERVDGREFGAAYWWRNVREPVRFRATMDSLMADGFDCFLELGPHPVLASSIGECSAGKRCLTFCSLRRGEDERPTMLNALAGLYASGFAVNWDSFRSPSARFVRLPAYPWQRERHWLESEESKADRIGAPAHPLLGRRLNSARPAWEVEISTRLLGYLQDHAVRGAVVYPGAAYVEMALAAGREVFGPGDVVVEDIRFERALFLPEGERPRMQIAIDSEEGTFEIHSPNSSGAWVRNAAGRLNQGCGSGCTKLEESAVQSRCPVGLDRERCYQQFAAQGFQYGPAFQKIVRIEIGDGEALAWFEDSTEEADYQLHPAVLDACFQVMVATDPFRSSGNAPAKTYLPVGIKRIRVRRRPVGSMWAWAYLSRRDESEAMGNIYLCDGSGAAAVEIEGFEVKALDTAEGSHSREQMNRNLYDVRWIAAPRQPDTEIRTQTGCWLVFADSSGAAASLRKRLLDYGSSVITVVPSEDYDFRAGVCRLNPGEAGHFERLLRDLETQVAEPLVGIAHMWNLDIAEQPSGQGDLESAERLGSVSVLHLAQAIARAGISPRLWLITRGAQPAVAGDRVTVMQSPVWGLGRVIGHQEHIGIWGGLIDLDPDAAPGGIDDLVLEMLAATDEDQVAFRSGERYVARLQHCDELKASLPVRLRADASYIVTGAFGALGQLTVRWMVERGARRLILMGRSALPERAQWENDGLSPETLQRIAAIRELESMGAVITLASIDVADETQLGEFLRQYEREGWPAIRGVVHSAGLVRDQLLVQMDARAFTTVLRPKVRGAWNLHRLLAGAQLDFFVLYSSVGSLVTSTGQANYAAANAFLDALAHHRTRRGLPALSINWGPWAVGMVKDLNLTDHYTARGMDVIGPEQGMRYLARLIGQEQAQAAVLFADWRKIFEFQPKVSPMMAHLAAEPTSGDSGRGETATEDFLHVLLMAEPDDQSLLMEQHLQGLAARVLRMDRENLDVSLSLSALGLDSMMAMELKNRIELTLHVPVSVLDLLKGVSIAEYTPALLSRLIEENAEIQQVLEEIEQSA